MMPKIRLGRFAAGPVEWRVGEQVRITVEDVAGTHDRVSTTYKGLAEDARAGDRLLVDDGRVGLWVIGVAGLDVVCQVVEGGRWLHAAGQDRARRRRRQKETQARQIRQSSRSARSVAVRSWAFRRCPPGGAGVCGRACRARAGRMAAPDARRGSSLMLRTARSALSRAVMARPAGRRRLVVLAVASFVVSDGAGAPSCP